MLRLASPVSVCSLALSLVLVAAVTSSCSFAPGPSSRSAPGAAELVSAPASNATEEDVVVVVNGRPIEREEFLRRVVEKSGSNTLRMEIVLDELVRQAAEKRGIEVTDGEVEEATESFLRGMGEDRGGLAKLESEFEARGFPLDAFRQDLRPQIRQELLRRRLIQSMRSVDDAALRKHYEETYKKKRFIVRHIAYSFLPRPGDESRETGGLKLEALGRAQRAIERVRSGHDFATLARAESDDGMTSSAGGLLPPVTEDSPMPPRFKEAIFALAPGQVTDPVENPDRPAWHVFQLVEIIPSQSYVDCIDAMRKEILEREPDGKEIASALESLQREARLEWKK